MVLCWGCSKVLEHTLMGARATAGFQDSNSPSLSPGPRSGRAATPGERVFPRKFCHPFPAALQKHCCDLGPALPGRQPRSWQCPGGFFVLRWRIFWEQGVCRGLGAGRDTVNPTAFIPGSIFSPSSLLQESLFPHEQGKW